MAISKPNQTPQILLLSRDLAGSHNKRSCECVKVTLPESLTLHTASHAGRIPEQAWGKAEEGPTTSSPFPALPSLQEMKEPGVADHFSGNSSLSPPRSPLLTLNLPPALSRVWSPYSSQRGEVYGWCHASAKHPYSWASIITEASRLGLGGLVATPPRF